ncbi:hypothetical protein MSAN_01228700 [Mycena sanguinolenta]|uniref:Uncharacterized protein n=1 Tax=Mycena sanguinolenta TaxID=230812 RepID=A0A8H7D1T4_9AGAR|nr:hypothetical protein MSAN_01228700 [Mycena sanguinolenta]
MADDPIFPTEIFETIVGNLVDDLDTLRSCALVSWTFYNLASLFTRLQVGPQVDQEHSLATLCELLEKSPFFAARVRSICLCESDECMDDHPRWIMKADLGRPAWPEFSVVNRDSIQSILPILTSLEVCSVEEFPLALLSRCSLLRSLTLFAVTFAKNSGPVVKVSRIQLRHLSLHLSPRLVDEFVDWITSHSPLDISCLSSLECTVLERRSIQRLLNVFAPGLRHLHIVNYTSFLSWRRYILDFRKLLHLCKLTLGMYLFHPDDDKRILSLRHILLPLQQKLALVINFELDGWRPEIVQTIASADSAWAALPIASVMINISDYDETSPCARKVDVSDEFIQQMPLLANKLADTGGLRVLKPALYSP